jgi:hypothetical protein
MTVASAFGRRSLPFKTRRLSEARRNFLTERLRNKLGANDADRRTAAQQLRIESMEMQTSRLSALSSRAGPRPYVLAVWKQ